MLWPRDVVMSFHHITIANTRHNLSFYVGLLQAWSTFERKGSGSIGVACLVTERCRLCLGTREFGPSLCVMEKPDRKL